MESKTAMLARFSSRKRKNDGIDSIKRSAKDWSWIALKYTQLRQYHTTPVLRRPNNEVAITMQAKEALVRANAFPKQPDFSRREIRPAQCQAYTWITQTKVQKALFRQSLTKAPGPDKFNFRAIRLLWS